MTTLSACEQAVVDLAALKAARLKIITGDKPVRVRHANKELDRAAPNLAAIDSDIRRLQNKIDGCNGRRPSYRFVTNMPVDGNGRGPLTDC